MSWIHPNYHDDFDVYDAVTFDQFYTDFNDTYKRLGRYPTVACITTPSYEGLVSEVTKIAAFCKDRGVRLLFDAAHGSILPFLPNFRQFSGIGLDGVDIVVNSLHKGSGAFSQTSIIHLNKTSNIPYKKFESAINMTCTTSPSNLLLASIEEVINRNFTPGEGMQML
jgi:arginine decarboxylase